MRIVRAEQLQITEVINTIILLDMLQGTKNTFAEK